MELITKNVKYSHKLAVDLEKHASAIDMNQTITYYNNSYYLLTNSKENP